MRFTLWQAGLILVLASCFAGAVPPATISQLGSTSKGLMALWHFNEASGDLIDLSSTGVHTGSLVGGCARQTGKFDTAIHFDGAAGSASTFTSTGLDFGTNNFSISWWVFDEDGIADSSMIARDNSQVSGFNFGYNGGTTYKAYMSANGTSQGIADGVDMGAEVFNTWINFVITRNGTNFYCYRNGVQQSTWSSSAGIYAGQSNFEIGRYWGSYEFGGKIDEVAIWDRALSLGEVQNLYYHNTRSQ